MKIFLNNLFVIILIGSMVLFVGCKQREIIVYSHENNSSYTITDQKMIDEFDSFCNTLSDPLNDKYANVFLNHIESSKNVLYFSYDELFVQNEEDSIIIECNERCYEFARDSEIGKKLISIISEIIE